MNLAANKDVEATMKYFQEWQKKMNPGDDTHPNHHDCAILITKYEMKILFYNSWLNSQIELNFLFNIVKTCWRRLIFQL